MTTDADDKQREAEQGNAFRTLRHRNFRLVWFGQLFATMGLQIQFVAIAWHLFELTDSTFQVGLAAAFGIAPFLTLSFVGGALADKFDRRILLLYTQLATLASAIVLFATTAAGVDSPAIIYAISFVSGLTRSFDGPARQALVPMLVPREELPNALTMNTMLRQISGTIGPGVGGVILGVFGIAPTYLLNAICVFAIVAALLMMDPIPVPPRPRGSNIQLFLGGLKFVRGEPIVLPILVLDCLVNIFASIRVLFPVYARDILEVGPVGLGIMYAAPSAGAVTGGLFLAAVGMRWRHPVLMLVLSAGWGLFVVGFGLASSFPVILIMLFGTGMMDVLSEVLRQTIVQLRTPDEVRGRVTSLGIIFTLGGPQYGTLQAGAIASAVGPEEAAIIGGAGVLASVAGLALVPAMRRQPDERPRDPPSDTGEPPPETAEPTKAGAPAAPG